MKIVITGGGGFVGRRLTQRLAGGASGVTVDRLVIVDQTLPDVPAEGVVGIEGDLSDPTVLKRALEGGCDFLFHLASVPGGAAEARPRLSREINIDATLDLFEAASATERARVVYTSSIAVLGDPLPSLVDDETPFRPTLTYGAHKLMAEFALADMTRRGALAGISVRLPGILAIPPAPSGLKSAFMSDLFHALAAGRPFVCPVGPEATIWAMSVDRCVDNLLHAAAVDPDAVDGQGVTLPALRPTMAALVNAVASATRSDPGLVRYQPDTVLQAQFGAQPPLRTPKADAAGFRHDGDLAALVARALHAAGLSA